MPEIVDRQVQGWLDASVPPRQGAFAAVEAEALAAGIPCIGPYEGQVLAFLAALGGARAILELGTATGYSALWLAQAAAQSGGRLTTVERDPRRAAEARANLARCGYGALATVVDGEAFAFLEGGDATFDCIFLDIVSHMEQPAQVDRLFAGCLRRLAPGGLLISDNALHAGEIARRPVPERARRYARYNELAFAHPELATIVLPVRDGLALSRRVAPGSPDA